MKRHLLSNVTIVRMLLAPVQLTARGVRTIFILTSILLALTLPVSAGANGLCPPKPADAAAQAKAVLGKPQETFMTDRDRLALLCLAEAVAAIDARLKGLSNGSIPFDGQIHIPKGWVITKPPAEEGE